tara:strand:+ start:216 stop:488 length:273 start_codon:yes stop_codon:yes gene_type:complete
MIWILSILLAISIYVNINLFRKIEVLEDANDEISAWIENYETSLKNILSQMREVDSKNLFESDDDVGGVFDSIKKTVESLEELSENAKEK